MKSKIRTDMFKGAKNSNWYFHVKSSNGKIIASSEGYTTKAACRKTATKLGFPIKERA